MIVSICGYSGLAAHLTLSGGEPCPEGLLQAFLDQLLLLLSPAVTGILLTLLLLLLASCSCPCPCSLPLEPTLLCTGQQERGGTKQGAE